MGKLYSVQNDKDKFRVILSEWFESGIPQDLKERKIIPHKIPKNVAFVLCGVRRSGKTYLLFEFAKNLREKNYLYNVVYLNLEDIRLHPLKPSSLFLLPEVLEEYFQYKKGAPFWFIFDEIQCLENWERVVRNYLDRNLGYVLISGSSSAVSPKEIASSMRGRTLTQFIYPLPFREFLEFEGYGIPENLHALSSKQKAHILKLGRRYLEFGGFPGVVLCEEDGLKKPMLRDIYQTIFFRDVVERFSIRNLKLMEIFMRMLMEQFSLPFSISKVYSFLTKTLGIKVTKNTLQEYLYYIKSAFILFEVEIFFYRLRDRMQYPRKLYLIDTGLANAVSTRFMENLGRLLENAVFLQLLREGKEVFYWKSKEAEEVDFVILKNFKPIEVIQVCWDLTEENIDREEKALIRCMKEFSMREGKIISWDYEAKRKVNDKWILYIPFWKWALKSK